MLGHCGYLVTGTQRAGPDQDGDLASGVEHIGGALQVGIEGDHLGFTVTNARMNGAMGAGRVFVGQVLQIVGQNHGSHTSLSNGRAHGAVYQMTYLFGRGCLLHERTSDVLEHRDQVQLLLIVTAQGCARLLAHDGQHRLMVHARVVQTGQQMRSTRAGRRDADAQLAGELGVGTGHEGSHLFVPGLDEFDLAARAVQGAEHTVDPVAWVTKDAAYAPLVQPLDQKIAYSAAHCLLLPRLG